MQRIFILLILSISIISCSILEPLVYRIPIQQGNLIDQEQVDKLQIGMTKEQVSFVLGTPMVKDAFDSNHWEYLYVLTASDGSVTDKTLSIEFKQNKLSSIDGDYNKDVDQSESKTNP
jgi:outer membrane protein assembly factor BamE